MNISIKAVATVTAVSALFGLALVSFASPSMAQQQGEQQMTTTDAATTPSPNGTTTISLQDLTNNQNVTEPIGGFTITQQWSSMLIIDPGTTAISHASCGEGQVVIGGGYYDSSAEIIQRRQLEQQQVLIPGVQIFFAGPSLSLNAYAVQGVNNHDSPTSIQVYALCLGAEGTTPAQAIEEQEGSPQ